MQPLTFRQLWELRRLSKARLTGTAPDSIVICNVPLNADEQWEMCDHYRAIVARRLAAA